MDVLLAIFWAIVVIVICLLTYIGVRAYRLYSAVRRLKSGIMKFEEKKPTREENHFDRAGDG